MKKTKLIISMLLVFSLMTINIFAVSYDEISVNGEPKQLTYSLVGKNNNVYVSLREISETLGYLVEWDNVLRVVNLSKNSDSFQIKPDAAGVVKNELISLNMSDAPYIENGVMYVPLNMVKDVLGLELSVLDEKYNIVSLSNDVVAEMYTMDQLYALALKNSEDLRTTEENVERSEITQDEAQASVGSSGVQSMRHMLWRAYYSEGIGLEMAKKGVETTKDSIYHNLLTAIETILIETNKLDVAEANMNVINTTYEQSKLKFELGLISSIDLDTARINYENSMKSSEMQKLTLESAWVDFNAMVGLEAAARVNVDYELVFKVMEDRDYETHIDDMLENSPSIWNLEQQIALAELSTRFYIFNVGGDPYEAEEIDITLAKINLRSAKDQLDASLRTLYNSIETLESNQGALELKVNDAENTLNLVKNNYEVGLVTLLDVKSAELALVNAKQNVLNNIATYLKTVRVYEKTWVNQ